MIQKSFVPFAQTKIMTFSRSFKGQVLIIHFHALFGNMKHTVHMPTIQIQFKTVYVYTYS